MAKSPLLGYNTNVRHKGRVFHIQTEDSGIQHPHIITHLFADGGRIIKSQKTSYAELVGTADMNDRVKKMMQDQHKAMFIALRDGKYDLVIDPSGSLSASVEQAATSEARVNMSDLMLDPAAGGASPPAAPAPAPGPKPPTPAGTPPGGPPAPAHPMPPGAAPGPPKAQPSLASMAAVNPSRPVTRPPSQESTVARGSSPAGARTSSPARAPDVFASFRPKTEAASPGNIFGDGLMSEKSLDEVILAYLAEDLDEPKAR